MPRKFIKWYQHLPPKVELLLAFMVYLLFWIGVSLIRNYWFDRRLESPLRIFSESVFMAFFITLFFEWKKVNLIFKKKE